MENTVLAVNKNKSRLIAFFGIFLAWICARIYVYYENWPYFSVDNADYSTFYMWYLPTNIIKNDLLTAMLYLRGEPPLPQLLLGLCMKLAGWPFSFPIDSMLSSLGNLIIAYLIFSILVRYGINLMLSAVVAVAWCIYPACLGTEVQAFPIAFYEFLPSFFVTLSLWLCLHCKTKDKQGFIWLFGLAGALLAMSRSTMSWIFILPLLTVFFLPGNKWRFLAGSLAITVQLLWSMKNMMVYGQFHLETAADVGQNVFSTILNTGNFDDFHQFSIQRNPEDPFAVHGLPCVLTMETACLEKYLPKTDQQDRALAQKLVSQEPLSGETYFMRALSMKAKPLYMDYLIHNPITAITMLYKSYQLFWGNIYWQVGYIKGLDTDPLILGINTWMEFAKKINVLGIHLLVFPIVMLILCNAAIKRQKPTLLQLGLLYAFFAFSYVAIVSSLGDHGENARYRIDVEPLVWLLPFMAVSCLLQQLHFSRPSKKPHP